MCGPETENYWAYMLNFATWIPNNTKCVFCVKQETRANCSLSPVKLAIQSWHTNYTWQNHAAHTWCLDESVQGIARDTQRTYPTRDIRVTVIFSTLAGLGLYHTQHACITARGKYTTRYFTSYDTTANIKILKESQHILFYKERAKVCSWQFGLWAAEMLWRYFGWRA